MEKPESNREGSVTADSLSSFKHLPGSQDSSFYYIFGIVEMPFKNIIVYLFLKNFLLNFLLIFSAVLDDC